MRGPEDIAGPSRTGRVVVVDDDTMIAGSLRALLERDGHRVSLFTAAEPALDFVTAHPTDAVVTDVSMPGMTGIELLARLREKAADVPVILVTGAPRVEDTIVAMELGAFRYLTKPFDSAEVSSVVHQAIQWGRLTRASSHSPAVADRAALERAFLRATASLRMVYQPIVGASTRRTFGYEALMRSDEQSLPSPPAVLAAAEKLGRLHALGRRIRALVAMAASSGPFDHTLFVNVHAADLADPELFDERAPLAVHARSVVLELTERASLEGIADIDEKLSALRALGYRVAVDDLGAGYAGLGYFARLSPEIVKIDMSLTRGIDADPVKRRIVEMVCQLAHTLDMLTVAEGIETEQEFGCVAEIGADLVQGYFVARPHDYSSDPPADEGRG